MAQPCGCNAFHWPTHVCERRRSISPFPPRLVSRCALIGVVVLVMAVASPGLTSAQSVSPTTGNAPGIGETQPLPPIAQHPPAVARSLVASPSFPPGASLTAVCPAAGSCVAVGSYYDQNGNTQG